MFHAYQAAKAGTAATRGERRLPISYEWAHWTPATIAVELSRVVNVKDFKLKKARGDFTKLLLAIKADEPMIDETIVRQPISLCRDNRSGLSDLKLSAAFRLEPIPGPMPGARNPAAAPSA